MKEKVDWKVAGEMLVEGCTFTEIAEHFGVSKQFVQQYYTKNKKGFHRRRKYKMAYPKFEEWFSKHHETYASIGRKLFPDAMNHSQTIRLIMIGQTTSLPIDTIKKLSQVTGMTFEEMFYTEDENDQQTV